ncbi:hypothetical protein BR93DRAFT_934065 [Coniochaeta sp. PMI_546]|nr:hypothetical protein BR93DRAFT_934065 [Coniochaeta sp. PMI_546]
MSFPLLLLPSFPGSFENKQTNNNNNNNNNKMPPAPMTEETGRALLAAIEEMAKMQKQLVDMARPAFAGHWGNATMALAAIGVAVAILQWFSVEPKDVATGVVAVFYTIGASLSWCGKTCWTKQRELKQRWAPPAAAEQQQQQQQMAPVAPAVAAADLVVPAAPAVPATRAATAADSDLERGDAVANPMGYGGEVGGGVGGPSVRAPRRRNQRSSETE